MKNINKVRANIRVELYNSCSGIFEKAIVNGKPIGSGTYYAKKVVKLFRDKIGYSETTVDDDIFYSAIMGYMRWKITGKSMYQSNKTVINFKKQSHDTKTSSIRTS